MRSVKCVASGIGVLGLVPVGVLLMISPGVGEPMRHPPAPMQLAQVQNNTLSKPAAPKIWTTGSHIRDGMEDFEYLIAPSKAGQDGFARSTAAGFITNAYTFDNNPQALLGAREALGNKLDRLARKGLCCLGN